MFKIDFTFKIYTQLLSLLKSKGYSFLPFKKFNSQAGKIVILRHDVDKLPNNSLMTAEIENSLSICGTYYFRIIPAVFNTSVIKKIEKMGHEIGYHYEDVDLVLKSQKSKIQSQNGNVDKTKLIDLAYLSFRENLQKLKKIAEISTICMHGSPLSKYDNKIIWNAYDYKKLGIKGEPYLDLDWNEWFYLTDTGRRWNGDKVSVRDKINTKYNLDFKSTYDIINNIKSLPDKILITVHPQRWTNNTVNWSKELITQSGKNIVKKYFYVKN